MNRLKVPQREEELRIGGIFPVTGYLSWSGKYKRKAAELKVAMINETGGVNGCPVRLIAYDDRSSVDQAARIAETLVFRHHVSAIVGTGSLPISRAVATVAEQNVSAALTIADRAYIMETGAIVGQGSAESLLADDEVRKRYLGM